ncbi:MAG: DUF3540 domain-containing protein [Polyangiaceae bacterium]|nr:DUF3540 domain-containing protein [Polyangiaceae bacterium]
MRDNLARQRTEIPATQELGTVVATLGRSLRVRTASGEYEARRAVSCLVEPELGDRVLLSLHAEGCHVLAVLDRDDAAKLRIVAPGDLELCAPAGQLTMAAEEGVRLVTPGEAGVASGTLRVATGEASLAVRALTYVGDQLLAQIDRAKAVTGSLESVADRWVQRVERAYRFVARSEQVRAEYLDYSATAAVHVKARATIVSGGELTKIDGGQIHVG